MASSRRRRRTLVEMVLNTLAAGQGAGREGAFFLEDGEHPEDFFEIAFDLPLGPGVGAQPQVVLDRQGAEDLPPLGALADAPAHAQVGTQLRNVFAVEVDGAGAHRLNAGKGAQEGRLALISDRNHVVVNSYCHRTRFTNRRGH